MVPEGWEYKSLNELLDKVIDYRGQSVPKSERGIPLITARNVRKGYLDFSTKEYVDEKKFNDWMKRGKPMPGDILFTTEAPLGNVCRYPESGEYAVAQRTVTLRTNEKLESEFLLHALLSEYGQRVIDLHSSGSTAKGIKSSELKKVKLAVPSSTQEQKKIAQILSTWDKAITTTEQLLANSQQQKKALMQQLLTGKKRLLDENGVRFSGKWDSIAVGELGKVVTGATPPKNDKNNYGDYLPWATADDFKQKYIKNTKVKLSEQGCKKARIVPPGSILVTCIASIGLNAIASESLATNQQINSIVVANGYSNEFIFYQLNKNQHKLMSLAGTTAVPIVNKSSFEKLALLIPGYSEQLKIASILVAQDEVIDKLKHKVDYLKNEKKALMQQLLTGKRRVKVDEEAA